MDSTGSISSVQTALDKLAAQRDELGELWATRKLRLDLCLQLRIFERDALEVNNEDFLITYLLINKFQINIIIFKLNCIDFYFSFRLNMRCGRDNCKMVTYQEI